MLPCITHVFLLACLEYFQVSQYCSFIDELHVHNVESKAQSSIGNLGYISDKL